MLMLKITDRNRKAYGGFQWPENGPVICRDWNPEPVCGGGLHGWANGQGSYRHSFNEGTFLVVEADDATAVHLDGGDKVKIPKGEVVYCGTREGAVAYLIEHKALTDESNPAWVCLTVDQMVTVAMRAADRAIRTYAPKALRARGREADALKLEGLPPVVDRATARNAAADAANYAAADSAAAAAAARSAANAANYAADAAANYAARSAAAANAAANAAYYAADAADAANAAAEREACRRDKLEMLGLIAKEANQ